MKSLILVTVLILFQVNCAIPIKINALTTNDSLNYDFQKIDSPWSVSADYFSYDRKNNGYKLAGNVIISNERANIRIRTDLVYINGKDVFVEAGNNTSIAIGEDHIVCQTLNFNLEHETGTIYNASIFFKQNNLLITGDKIEKTYKNKYIVDKGFLTTCTNENPVWIISGKDIKIEKGKHGTLKNAVLKIKKVPIIYLPYFMFPTSKRQSGFLSPKIKYANRILSYCQPIFLKINDISDITFFPSLKSDKGWSIGLEYRLKNQETKGLLLFDWGRNGISCEDNFYWLRSKIDKELLKDFVIKSGINLMKNIGNLESSTIKETRKNFRDFVDQDVIMHDNFRTNYLIFNKIIHTSVFNTAFYWDWNINSIPNGILEDKITPTNEVVLVQFDSIISQVANLPLYSNITMNLSHKSKESIFKAYFEPIIHIPILFRDFALMDFCLASQYDNNFQNEFCNHNLKLNLSSEFSKKYKIDKENKKSFKHLIEIQATYEHNHKTDNLNSLGQKKHILYKNLFAYSVSNSLLAKYKDETGCKYRELFSLNLCHSFKEDDVKNVDSSIEGELYFNPNDSLVLQLSASFDPFNNWFSMCSSEICVNNSNNSYFSFGYFQRRNETELLKASIQVPIAESLTALMACGYDNLEKNNELMGFLALYYDAQCWSAGIRYEKDMNEKHGSISISVELLGFGSDDKQKRVNNILFNKESW